jgi:radical SAM superfamily enzyme YgiQ (UPF0313 family)
MVQILNLIEIHMKGVKRVGTYANAKSILRKTVDDLIQLREHGLKIAYLGIETGNDELLRKIKKGVASEEMIQAGHRIKEAGIILSATIILGIGGIEKSIEHAFDTARILTKIDPEYASALTLMLVPGTPLYSDYISGNFVMPDKFGLLKELGIVVENSNLTNCYFTSNHASNYLPIKASLPLEKRKAVNMIHNIIKIRDIKRLRPEHLRGL